MTDTRVPHPRDVFVFVARVRYLEPKPVLVMRSEDRPGDRSRGSAVVLGEFFWEILILRTHHLVPLRLARAGGPS